MSWIAIVFIVLAIAMMVGPIMMLRPNSRQRHIADLRAGATQRGYKVYLDSLDGEEIAVYQILWPTSLRLQYGDMIWYLVKQKHPHEMHFLGRWQWRDKVKPGAAVQSYLQRELASLPESVQAVAATQQGLCCYWKEQGGEPDLQTIEAWLKDAQAHLWPLVQQKVEDS